ncbi:LysR substrate-binding domain-containing protein [Bordetella avium]|uniref:LysR-family transcriptional regulator n=1 Tax=Bordetella avium (strain 197N) TaxID=360910 RepID=Q2KVE3_BORA1|nr:LysR substrate-binding domain-containing protein [Bordetella avium]RIQ54822.1 LysR family transcriptional regulator [Bordetella avium]RIQ70683.1 LysR family transcriptional regulator [Bordetella avium]CAJ48597.1 LysR-family transcriptional regulator [Bordetella avium 197N]
MIDLHENPDIGWSVSLRQLELFRAVATRGSLRAAARHLGLSQPTLTHSMKVLEQGVGAPLFVRSAKGSSLTGIGQTLLRHSQLALNELHRAQEEIARLQGERGGRVAVGFSSAATSLLPLALSRFQEACPGVTLALSELSSSEHDRGWLDGTYDFIVSSEVDEHPADAHPRELLYSLPLTVMARSGHPLGKARSLAELQDALWVLPEYGPALLRRLFESAGLAPPRRYVMCLLSQIAFTLLRFTDALGMMAPKSLATLRNAHDLRPVPLRKPVPATLRVSLLARDLNALTPVAQRFADCLREAARLRRAGNV